MITCLPNEQPHGLRIQRKRCDTDSDDFGLKSPPIQKTFHQKSANSIVKHAPILRLLLLIVFLFILSFDTVAGIDM